MSGQLAKPVTPHWPDAQIGQEAWLMLGLSKSGESGLSPHLLEVRSHGSANLPIGNPKGQQGTPTCWFTLWALSLPQIRCVNPHP